MTLDDTFKQSDLLHLASGITSRLREGSAWMQIDQRTWTVQCGGLLNLSHDDIQTDTSASCVFVVSHDWIYRMPIVCCKEAWVKKLGADWHVYANGVLCFDLDLRWKDEVARAIQEHGIIHGASFAATWCLNSSRWLLYRHHFAHVHNIHQWPKEWLSWRHGKDGQRDYRWQKSRTAKETNGH